MMDWRQRVLAEYFNHTQKYHLAQMAIKELEESLQKLRCMGFPLHVEEGPPPPTKEWPRFVFHIRQGARECSCEAEFKELGPDWFYTIEEARYAAGEAKQWQRGGVFSKSLPAPINLFEAPKVPEKEIPQESRENKVARLRPARYQLPAIVIDMPGVKRA